MVENRLIYTFGLTATTSDRRLSTSSNMGFVRQKAWCASHIFSQLYSTINLKSRTYLKSC